MKKRVLIVTYYWPPSAGGGVQRWLKFSKYLPENGWDPVVYTPLNPNFNLTDDSLLEDIPDKMEVIKTKIWEPYALASLFQGTKKSKLNTGQTNKASRSSRYMNWIRGNFFIPDPRKFWVKPSITHLLKYFKENPIDVIITTGPPHSMHLIGLGLKKALGNQIKWVVDIRDPWSRFDLLDSYAVSRSNLRKYARMESEVLKTCDKVIATSPSMIDELQSFPQSKFQPITNGFDEADFSDFKDTSHSNKLNLYHAGLISDLRNPNNFWTALNNIIKDERLDKKVSLRLVGTLEAGVSNSISSFPSLSKNFEYEGYKDHDEVIKDYQSANVLLLFVNNSSNAKVNIPGKTFEYLATGKPIICFSPNDTDVAEILSGLPHCLIFSYEDSVEKISQRLVSFLSTIDSVSKPEDIKKYSRKELTRVLVKTLENL